MQAVMCNDKFSVAMKKILILTIIFGLQTESNAETVVRCLAKIEVENTNKVMWLDKENKYQLRFKRGRVAIPKTYWNNTCELDFPYALRMGMKSESRTELEKVTPGQIIYFVGEAEENNSKVISVKLMFFSNESEYPILKTVDWPKFNDK
ncbi:MAG: hypothetical protein OEZ39_20415 [Gammaproteobacteria bacterium]|nr:hypothetical protein [Gammaproteobacteria bacterium]MDH5654226.1 hypothetical protein [Gammaproteobacteria bacterium]